jgi:hypothetical protein
MSDRRKFLRNGGLLGMFAMGAATPVVIEKVRETQVPTPVAGVDPNIIKQIEEICPPNVTICSTYGEIAPPPPPPPSNGMSFYTVGSGGTIGYNEVMRLDSSGNLGIGTSSPYGNLYNGTKRFVPGTEKQVSVKMVPGPDGELYINVNGQWKKVLTT